MDQPRLEPAAHFSGPCDNSRNWARTVQAAQCQITLWFGIFIVMLSTRSHSQESIRVSLASEQAAATQNPIAHPDYFDVRVGAAYLRFQGEMGIELNDNVNYTETNRRSDMILRPLLNSEILWPLTGRNSFSFSCGLGYVHYIRTGTLDHPYVSPDSKLDFKVYSGDFVFDLHDRFSAQDNVLQTPSLSGTGNYFQIENVSGLDATWDLYKLILSLSYDYDQVSVLSGPFTSFTHGADLFEQRSAFLVNSTDQAGLEIGGGLINYDQPHLENNTELAIGPFYEIRFSSYVRAKLLGGFVAHLFEPTSYSALRSFDSYYLDLTVNHEVNKWFNYWLSVGRRIEGGTPNASLYVDDYAYYQANFYAIKDTRLGVHFSYDHGDTSGGFNEVFDRFGAGVFFDWSISQNLTVNVTYEFWRKDSELYNYGYVQNRLLFNATYKF
jgi:hypothetical protein